MHHLYSARLKIIFAIFVFGAGCFAGGVKCRELLESPVTLEGWVDLYHRAEQSRDTDLGGAALLQILRYSGQRLSLSPIERFALYRYGSLVERYGVQAGDLKLYRTWTQRASDLARATAADAIWATGPPTFLRAPVVFLELQIAKSGVNRVYRRLGEESFRRRLPVADDSFLQDCIKEVFADSKATTKWLRTGSLLRIGRPIYFSFLLFAGGYHPTLQIKSHVEGHYAIEAYLEDAGEVADLSVEGKRVGMLVDQTLLPTRELGVGDSDPLHAMDTSIFSKGAATFKVETIDGVDEFEETATALQDSEILVIFFHGLPGDFAVNGESIRKRLNQIQLPRLPQGARIIFISCLLGSEDPNSSQSPVWLEISRRMLPKDGMSIASEQVLVGTYSAPMVSASRLQIAWTKVPEALQWTYAQGTQGAALVPWRAYQIYFGEPSVVGFKVYDAETDSVSTFRHDRK